MKRCPYCGKSYADDLETCPTDAEPPISLSPLPSSQAAAATADDVSKVLPAFSFPVREALVTITVLLLCLAAQRFPLPTLHQGAKLHPLLPSNSIVVLGVQPVLSAFVLVEIVALLVPAWRPLRNGGRAGREKLRYASFIVGMFLALGQAFFMSVAFERFGSGGYGAGFRVLTILILLGATAALVGLAKVVDGEGLVGGFAILLLAFTLPHITGPLAQAYDAFQQGALPASALKMEAVGLALLVGATLWFFSDYCFPGTDPEDHPARLSRPACGVTPLSLAAGVLVFASRFFSQFAGHSFIMPWYWPALLSILMAIGFAYLFNLPHRVSAMWKALSPFSTDRPPRTKFVLLECVIFIALAMLIEAWLDPVLGKSRVPAVIFVILATGIIADIVRELRARAGDARLVPIWEIHQVYGVASAMRLLQSQGFHPFAKGLRLRSLLQFFGPYAPILVLVPASEAKVARAILESRWPVLDSSAK